MDRADFPWRTLGTLLVEENLLAASDVDRALAEQRQTGRLLGQILVDQGSVTAVALARALARQHGVALGSLSSLEPEPWVGRAAAAGPPPSAEHEQPWRPLGAVLVEQALLTNAVLQAALAEQRDRPERRLGEILVECGHLSGAALASALADQHGLDVGLPALAGDVVETVLVPVAPGQPSYEVCSVGDESAGERRTVLYEGTNLLDAADFACDYVDRRQPFAVEIQRRDGEESETVWTYSRERAEAAASSAESLVETFGFDPTRWGTRS
jgi:hypothetical protein